MSNKENPTDLIHVSGGHKLEPFKQRVVNSSRDVEIHAKILQAKSAIESYRDYKNISEISF
jgi:hypothetical protein